MNTKLILATVAALGFATSAFASDGGEHTPFVYQSPALSGSGFNTAPLVPDTRSESTVQSYNSLPQGFEQGTQIQRQANAVNQYFASHGNVRAGFAAAAMAGSNG